MSRVEPADLEALLRQTEDLHRAPPLPGDVQVVYAPPAADGGVVEDVLQAAHIDLLVRAGKPGGTETNAVWFGAEVPEELAEKVAVRLTEADVVRRCLGPFSKPDAKLDVIEIGAADQLATQAPLNTMEIMAFDR